MTQEKMYRYQESIYSTGDDDYGYTRRIDLYLMTFDVVKTTAKGKWIHAFVGDKPRFVLNNSRKRYAHETQDLALKVFQIRKRKEISILEERIRLLKTLLPIEEKER